MRCRKAVHDCWFDTGGDRLLFPDGCARLRAVSCLNDDPLPCSRCVSETPIPLPLQVPVQDRHDGCLAHPTVPALEAAWAAASIRPEPQA